MALVEGGAAGHDDQLMMEMGLRDSTWKSVRHLTSNPLEPYIEDWPSVVALDRGFQGIKVFKV